MAGLALVLLGSGCAPPPPPGAVRQTERAPYHLLPPDEMMSCPAIAESFRYSVARVVRLKIGLAAGASGTFQTGPFSEDAPEQITQEEQRLDALADLERDRGCPVVEPRLAVDEALARAGFPVCYAWNGRCLTARSTERSGPPQ